MSGGVIHSHRPFIATMMKIINAAYDALKDYDGEIPAGDDADTQDYPQAVNDALNAVIDLEGLEIEICGAWVWVGGAVTRMQNRRKTQMTQQLHLFGAL
jgi:hypothetical protein